MPRPRKLRRHLFQVLLIGILPVGLLAAGLLFVQWHGQEQQRAHIQVETTRVLAAAVDNALDSTVQRLSILGRLWTGAPADRRRLYEHARSALEGSPDWETVIVFEASGAGVFRADLPFGADIPPMVPRPYSQAALSGQKPAVSGLFLSTVTGRQVVGVAVPIVRGGKATHVVIASLNLDWFDELLRRQGLPEGGIGGIFDGEFKFVARSHDGERRRGGPPQSVLHARMQQTREGIDRFDSLDGASVFTAWTQSRHGWWIAFATPAEPILGAFWRNLLVFGGLWLGVVLAGLAFASLKGKRITSSLATLENRAHQLAHGEAPLAAVSSPVAEVDQALQALERAAALLDNARRERDRAFATEREARAVAEAASRAKDEFLAMLGHELRNPLAAIASAGTIIRFPGHSAKQREFASGVIERQTAHLKRLIDDLLDVGRVMTGKIRLDRAPLSLRASVEHVVATLQSSGALRAHRLRVEAQDVWVNGDQTRIEQVLSNLLANAATYTPAGGDIEVRLEGEAGTAMLSVRDNGIGIGAEDLPRLFDLFFQAAPSNDRRHGGLGIGLTLVKRLVELHGGTVQVHSAGRGKGTIFTVRLPAVPRREGAAPEAQPQERQTVLVVEDNDDERDSLRVALEQQGHEVLHAADGVSALSQLDARRPGIALIDIGLPGMDGLELARQIRSRFDGSIRLIAVSGYGTAEDARRSLAAGFAAHLTKPVEVSHLARLFAKD